MGIMALTTKERFSRTFHHESVDQVGLFEVFWQKTSCNWTNQGGFGNPEAMNAHFGLPYGRCGRRRGGARRGNKCRETRVSWQRAPFPWLKTWSGTPEHVDCSAKDCQGWKKQIEPRLLERRTHEGRLQFDRFRKLRMKAAGVAIHDLGVVGVLDSMSLSCGCTSYNWTYCGEYRNDIRRGTLILNL
jgi:hypothetical protein